MLVLGLPDEGKISRKVQDVLLNQSKTILAEELSNDGSEIGYSLEVENVHVWQLSESVFVCSLKAVLVPSQANEKPS